MIYGIAGRPGGGKSYEAVAYHILPAIKAGRKVITNISLNVDYFVKIFGPSVKSLIVVIDGQLTDFGSRVRPFSKLEHYQDEWRDDNGVGPLYVIDEAHMVIPSRGASPELLEWYSMHRHYGVDIIVLTQNLRKLHRDVKDMIELSYVCQKNTALGSENSYTRKVRHGANGDTVNTGIREYKSSYFPFYQSHTASNVAVQEAHAQDVVPFWKRWPVVGSVLCLTTGTIALISAFASDSGTDLQEQQAQAILSSASVPEGTPSPELSEASADTLQDMGQTSAPTEQPAPPAAPTSSSKITGPLQGFEFYVSGYAKQIVYSTENKPVDPDLIFYRVYVDVYNKDQKLFSLNSYDLREMGYGFRTLADCVYELDFNGAKRVITCGEKKMEGPMDMISF